MDEHNELGQLISSVQTGEEEVDDGRYKHDCCRTVRKSSPPVKGLGIRSCKRLFRTDGTNKKMTTDAEKNTANTPVIKLVDEPHGISEEDEP